MKKEVTFFKQDGKWYADVPNHTLEENEMVMGADIALELLSADYNAITLHLTDEEPNDYQLAFKMTERYEDFTKKGVKIVTIPIDNKDNGDS